MTFQDSDSVFGATSKRLGAFSTVQVSILQFLAIHCLYENGILLILSYKFFGGFCISSIFQEDNLFQ